jgi:hypothetical protein
MEPNRKLFLNHLPFILHHALVGTVVAQTCKDLHVGEVFPTLLPSMMDEGKWMKLLTLWSHGERSPPLTIYFESSPYGTCLKYLSYFYFIFIILLFYY